MKWGKNNYVLYLFVSFWYYYICIQSRSIHMEVFLKKLHFKILQNSQENTCAGVSFLSAASNFINEETWPKSLTLFAKNSIVDIRLDYKYVSVLPADLIPI